MDIDDQIEEEANEQSLIQAAPAQESQQSERNNNLDNAQSDIHVDKLSSEEGKLDYGNDPKEIIQK